MIFELPFSDETIMGLVGKTMILSNNHRSESLFGAFDMFQSKDGCGTIEQGHLEVENGVLRLIDDYGLFCEFNGLETRSGAVFATGTFARLTSRNGFERIVMHEQKALPISDFGICISSHVSYEKSTLPRLLESIRKANFDMSKVVAVVGGFRGDKTTTVEGAQVIYKEANGLGFGGLTETNDCLPYWLLLHDTCEAERTFLDCVSNVDVGLNPDVIRLRTDIDDWTGFYKTSFVSRIKTEIKSSPNVSSSVIKQWAQIVTTIPGNITHIGFKDVYGNGHRRTIQKLSAGIRKFKGSNGRRIP